jgi:hypothetical protein
MMRTLLLADILPDIYSGLHSDPADPNSPVELHSINDIAILISNLIQIALTLAGLLAVIFIIYAGIQYIVSQGDPGRVQSAKSTLRNAIIGLVLTSGAYFLVNFFAGQFK